MDEQSHQLQEVLEYVAASESKSCAIVHTASETEVTLESNEDGWNGLGPPLREPPDAAKKANIEALGFEVKPGQMLMRFGPRRGETIHFHRVVGRYPTLESAANSGLSLVRLLAGVGPAEWLWITESEFDSRPVPPPTGPTA